MKFHLTRSAGRNLFTGYGEGYVRINDERYETSVIVAAERPVTAWKATRFDALTIADFEALLELQPEIVILGTGERMHFPSPRLTQPLARSHIGFEAMDTRAACRTYNVLMEEGRQVVAAILIERAAPA